MNRDELFEKAPIPRAVATMAIPSIVTTLVTVLYNLADTFFIGQTGDAIQVASVSLAFPVFSVFMGFGNLFGVGGCSAISRSLGSGRKERAKNISSFCFYGGILTGIALAVIVLIFINPILNLIGASDATFDYAKSYLTIISIGSPFIIAANCSSNLQRGEGAANASMIGHLIGTVTNIILDPVFILGLGWGVAGAAAATVLGNMLACVYYIVYFSRAKTLLSLDIRKFKTGDHIASSVVSIGFPSSLNQLLMSFANVIMNVTITQYGDLPLAAMNVAMKANMIVVFVQMGLCMGVQPLFGYNYGSGNKKRLTDIFRFTGITTVILGTLLTLFMVFARRYVVAAFIDDQEVIDYGIQMVVALELSGPFVGLTFLCTNCLQGMGKALQSMILTLCRQCLVYIPAIFILDRIFGLDGLIYAQPISDYFSIILGLIVTLTTLRKIKPSGKYAAVAVNEQN